MAGVVKFIGLEQAFAGSVPVYEQGQKPKSPLELGIIAGDVIVEKLVNAVPVEPIVIATEHDLDGHVAVKLDDFNIGLGVALGATEGGDITVDRIVEAVTALGSDEHRRAVAHVTQISQRDDFTPYEIDRLTPTHPDVVAVSPPLPVPAVRIIVDYYPVTTAVDVAQLHQI